MQWWAFILIVLWHRSTETDAATSLLCFFHAHDAMHAIVAITDGQYDWQYVMTCKMPCMHAELIIYMMDWVWKC